MFVFWVFSQSVFRPSAANRHTEDNLRRCSRDALHTRGAGAQKNEGGEPYGAPPLIPTRAVDQNGSFVGAGFSTAGFG
jgi:hypothetical protein